MSDQLVEKKIDTKFEVDYSKLNGRGGRFIISPIGSDKIFTREEFSEDHKMFESAALEFAEKTIFPEREKLESHSKDMTLEMFRQMGELGFLGVDTPEPYGGLGLDKTTACIVCDILSFGGSVSLMVTMAAHTGIASLPIIWYGNEEQKQKYLPKLASGEWMGCYALTEPSAGSDALSGQMKAHLSEDKEHYILNGQKIYITNGSWSDVCVTFANIDGRYTGFIVDKDCSGWSAGEEEKKMGIKGSSTVTLYFEDCKVPVENMIGKVGQGSAIAFNVLYAGRYKLGVSAAAGAKICTNLSYDFANEREQFSRAISKFAMMKRKMSEMVVKSWEADSLNYMTCGSIDESIKDFDKDSGDYFEKVQKVIEDHAIEASICKVVGSEALAYNVDEGVQIHGGAGFIEDYPICAMYRDERINRIFEGTNEINRLLAAGTALKKALLEDIPIRDSILQRENNWIPEDIGLDECVAKEGEVVEFCRSLNLYIFNLLITSYGQDLKNEQWVMEPYSNILISMSILDTTIKRYIQGDESKKRDMLPVLRLSIANQYDSMIAGSLEILAELGESKEVVLGWVEKLNYNPSNIQYKKQIYRDLDRYRKYYLD
ncbi:MAG: acyl-CoA dehydrogenase [Candidatus Marinimicrobia bacterium]|nr:acyl-CoA dehydrogenase [Candidatus Neomarinimicrobiota bacterium]